MESLGYQSTTVPWLRSPALHRPSVRLQPLQFSMHSALVSPPSTAQTQRTCNPSSLEVEAGGYLDRGFIIKSIPARLYETLKKTIY